MRQIKGQNRQYLAHEYFNRDWRPLWFAEMVDQLAPAKLTYACSATYLDHINALNMTAEQHRFLGEITDPVFRQTVRDFVVNQQFRRDYWIKGPRRMAPLEQAEALRRLKGHAGYAAADVALKVAGPLGQRDMARTSIRRFSTCSAMATPGRSAISSRR